MDDKSQQAWYDDVQEEGLRYSKSIESRMNPAGWYIYPLRCWTCGSRGEEASQRELSKEELVELFWSCHCFT